MSWTDEEIDKLVQESSSMHQVEYKDAYWKEMEAMLNQEATSRKGGIWWWLTSVVLLIGGASTFYALKMNDATINKQLLASNQSAGSQQSTQMSDVLIQQVNQETTFKELENNNDTYTNTQNARAQNGNKTVTQNILQQSNSYNKSQINKLGSLQNVNTESLENGFDENSYLVRTIAGTTESNGNILSSEKNENSINPSNPTNESNVAMNVNDLAIRPWEHSILTSIAAQQDELPIFPRNKVGFYVAMNGGIGQSYLRTSSNNAMYQVGVDGGVEFFKGKWNFAVGAGVRQQYVNNLEMNSRRNYYSYGLVNVNSDLSYDQLIFADLKLSAAYSFGKSAIGITVKPNYLLGARLSYSQIAQETVGNEIRILSNETINHKYVSSQNFNSFGLNTGISYSYALPKNYLIQVELNTRLGNKLLNSSFNGTANKLPLLFELGIKKRF